MKTRFRFCEVPAMFRMSRMTRACLSAVAAGAIVGAVLPVGLSVTKHDAPTADPVTFNVVNEDQSAMMRECIEGPGRPYAIWQDADRTVTWWADADADPVRNGYHGHILVSCNVYERTHNTY